MSRLDEVAMQVEVDIRLGRRLGQLRGDRSLLSPSDRVAHREQAIALWNQAKELRRGAERLIFDAGCGSGSSGVPATALVDQRRIQRIDEMIVGSARAESMLGVEGVGLVIARRVSRVAFLYDTLREHLPMVWSVRDPFDGVGAAITRQPDITLVDDDLAAMAGLEAAWLVRSYVPRGGVVLLARGVESTGGDSHDVTTCSPETSRGQLHEIIEDLLAS